MMVNGGELVAQALQREGIDQVFGLIGYYVSPIFAACAKMNVRIYDTRHEQAAIHMADGYTQACGDIAVAVVTGGPGFVNSVSAIVKAYKAFTPLVVITGGFPPHKKDVGGLEDMDQLALVKSYTNWCATVYDTARIPEYIAMAIRYATTGRRGPVVLEIPINYLLSRVPEESIVWPHNYRTQAQVYGDVDKIREAVKLLRQAKKPIIIAGAGTFYSKASKELSAFADYTGIPTFTVNAGRGVIPDSHRFCYGSGRSIEGGAQLYALKNADVVFVIGSSLDYSVSFAKPPVFGEDQKFIQIDIDGCEIGLNSRSIDVGIIGHSNVVLRQMLQVAEMTENLNQNSFTKWRDELDGIYERFATELAMSAVLEQAPVHPIKIIDTVQKLVSEDSIIVTDGSNAMFWGCLLFKCNNPGHSIVGPNGTYGQMGTGLPLALGAKLAEPDKTIILYTGDGSIGFNLIEINTAIRLGIKIIIIIHNDSAWGFCKETQRCIFGESDCGVGTDLGFTRYDEIVAAFGGHGELVEEPEQLEDALKRSLASDKISCINVITDGVMSPGANFLNGTVK